MTTQTKKRLKHLTCGCCGDWFKTWPTYRDQDRDKGYGICRPCQAWQLREDRKEERKAFALLRSALNETNQAKFDACPPWKKRYLIAKAFEDGHLTYSIQARARS